VQGCTTRIFVGEVGQNFLLVRTSKHQAEGTLYLPLLGCPSPCHALKLGAGHVAPIGEQNLHPVAHELALHACSGRGKVYVPMRACVCVCMSASVCLLHICLRVHAYVHVYVCRPVWLHVCLEGGRCVCAHVHAHLCPPLPLAHPLPQPTPAATHRDRAAEHLHKWWRLLGVRP